MANKSREQYIDAYLAAKNSGASVDEARNAGRAAAWTNYDDVIAQNNQNSPLSQMLASGQAYEKNGRYYINNQKQEEDEGWAKAQAARSASQQRGETGEQWYTNSKTEYDAASKLLADLKKTKASNTEIERAAQRLAAAQEQLGYSKYFRFSDILNDKDYQSYVDKGKSLLNGDTGEVSREKPTTLGGRIMDFFKRTGEIYSDSEIGAMGSDLPMGVAVRNYAKDDSDEKINDKTWSEDEKNTYLYLLGRDGETTAKEYAIEINSGYAKKEQESQQKALTEWSQKNALNGVLGTAASIATAASPMGIVDFLNLAAEYVGKGRISQKDYLTPTEMTTTVQSAIATSLNEKYGTLDENKAVIGGKGWGDAYQLASSIVTSWASIGMGGQVGSLAYFFGNAASQGTQEALDRGLAPEKAVALGFCNGLAEVLGEKFSVDNLIHMKSSRTLGQFLKSIGVQAGIEGSEEGFTTFLNTLADNLINGDMSEYNQKVNALMGQGMGYEEAKKQALKDSVNDLAFDILGGAISGGVSAGGGSFIQNLSYNGDSQLLIDTAKQVGSDSDVLRAAEIERAVAESKNGQLKRGEAGELMGIIDKNNGTESYYKAAEQKATTQAVGNAFDGLDLNDSQKEVLVSGFEAGDADAATYAIGAREAFQLGKMGLSLEKATEQAKFGASLNETQFRHAWQLGAGQQTTDSNAVDVATPEGKERLASALSMLGEHAETAADVYDGKQDVSRFSAAMNKAANLYAANGVDVKAVAQEIKESGGKDIITELSDEQLETAAKIGAQIRAQNAAQAKESSARLTTLRQQADAILAAAGTNSQALNNIDKAIAAATKYGQQEYALYQEKVTALEEMVKADPEAENTEAYQKAVEEADQHYNNAVEARKGIDDLQEKRKELQSKQTVKRKKGTVSFDGGVDPSSGKKLKGVDRSKLTNHQKNVVSMVEALADIINIDYVFFDGDSNVGGEYIGDGVIYININSGVTRNFAQGIAAASLSHELTHFMQEYAPEEYNELKDFIVSEVMKKSPSEFDALVKQQLAWQPDLTYAQAVDEVIANSCQNMLLNSQYIAQFAREHMTAAEKVKDTIHDIVNKIKAAYEGIDFKSGQGPFRAVQAVINQSEAIQKRWDKALEAATRNYNAEQTAGSRQQENNLKAAAQTTGVKYQTWDDNETSSIKQQLKDHESELNQRKPVASVTVNDMPKDPGKQRQWAVNRLKSTGYSIDRKGFGTIEFSPRQINTGLSYLNEQGEVAAFAALPAVLKRGEIIDEHGRHKGRPRGSVTIAAPVSINGVRGNMAVVLTQTSKTHYHTHRILMPDGSTFVFENQNVEVTPAEDQSEKTHVSRPSLRRSGDNVPENGTKVKMQQWNKKAEKVGVEIDQKTESANPGIVQYSRWSWEQSDYFQNRREAAKALAEALGVSEKKALTYIDSINGVAKAIANDQKRLDYEASEGVSALVGNTEYGGSIDFSTICKKRRLLTGTFTAIQKALPNTALTAEEILTIRKMMADKGDEVSCGLCYVEGSRAKMGIYARQFLDEYAKTKPKYLPNMAEINTPEGIELVRKQHPETYAAYVKFMNSLAQRKPKLYQMATEYAGEVLNKFLGKKDQVDKYNHNGGLRLQSFSDFEIIHLIDNMQVIMDMARVGLNGQAYTKVPEFAWSMGKTGLKINMSLIAKGVDENGHIILDEKEGMKRSDAEAIRNAYSENVGTILVVFNDAQLKAAMADDFIDFIIPFHRSQWNSQQYALMGLPEGAKDYTPWQNESYLNPVYNKNGKKIRPDNFMPNNYWDYGKTGKENAESYLRMCAADNRKPKFSNLLVDNGDGSYSLQPDGSTDGYWKLLIDFKMYDNDGNGAPQNPVKPIFNEGSENDPRTVLGMLKAYEGGHQTFPVDQEIVDKFVSDYKAGHPGQSQFQKWDSESGDFAFEAEGREMAYAMLQAENKTLQDAVDGLNELIKKQDTTIGKLQKRLKLTKDPGVRLEDAKRLANQLTKKHGSVADKAALAEQLKALGDYVLQSKEINQEELKQRARAIAADIVENAETISDLGGEAETYRSIVADMRGAKLTIDKDFLGELGTADGYDAFRKKNFGNFTLARRETGEAREGYKTVGSFYLGMQQGWGKAYFPDVKNEGEQIQVIASFFDLAKPEVVNPYEKYLGEATEELANEIVFDALDGVMRQIPPTTADRWKAKTDDARARAKAAEKSEEKAGERAAETIYDLSTQLDAAESREKSMLESIRELERQGELSEQEAQRMAETIYDLSVKLDAAKSKYKTLQKEARYRSEQIRAEGRDRQLEIRAEEKAKANERVKAVADRYKEIAKRAKERRQENAGATKYRKQIEKKAKQLYEMLMKNSDKEHIPEVLKGPLAEFLTSIDFSSKRLLSGGEETQRDAKFGARLMQLQQLLAGQQDYINGTSDGSVDLGGYIDVSPESLQFLKDTAQQITAAMAAGEEYTINRMSADQLRDLSNFLSSITKAIKNMNSFMANERYADVREAASQDIDRMNKLGKAGEKESGLLRRLFKWDNGTPYYVFRRFGKGGVSIFEGLTKGWDKMAFNVQEIINFTEKLYTTKEVNEWKSTVHEITLEDGSKIKMTTAQLMELSMLLNREQALKHIEKGGIRVGDIETKKGKITDVTHYHLTMNDIHNMLKILDGRQMEVAKALQTYMATKGAEWGNEISMRRFGYNFYTEGENYFPIKTDANDRPMADTDAQQNSMFRLLNLSSSKSLNPRASNALIIGDIFDTFSDHMADQAKLNGLGLPILDAIKWFNFKERIDLEDGSYDTRTLQAAMEQTFGGEAQKYFRTLMKDVNGLTESGDRGKELYSKMTSNYKVAAVAANLRVALLQPTSYVRASFLIRPKYLLAAFMQKNAYKEAMEYSGTAVWKSLGYYDTNIARNMRDQIQHNDSVKDNIVEKTMIGAEVGDKLTWGRLWIACKLQAKAENNGISGEELMQKTADLFREVVYSSQVMDSTLTRSSLMRSSSGFNKMLTPFMAEPTLSYNILLDAFTTYQMDVRENGKANAWARNKGNIGKAFAVYTASASFAALVESLWDAVRDADDDAFFDKFLDALLGETGDDDEEEETAKDKFFKFILGKKTLGGRKWLSGNLYQDLSILSKLPYLKNLISLLQGYTNSDMLTSGINIIIQSYKIWSETISLEMGYIDKPTNATYYGHMTPWGKIYKTLQGLSQLSGIAVSATLRDTFAIWNTIIGGAKPEWKIRTYNANAMTQSEKRAYNEYIKGTGITQKQYQKILQLSDADGNGNVKQAELSDYIKNELAAGNLTEEQVTALWDAQGWKTSYAAYSGKENKKAETSTAAAATTTPVTTPAPKAKLEATTTQPGSGKITTYDQFKKSVKIYSDKKETAYQLWESTVKPLGVDLDTYTKLLNESDTNGNDSVTQDELGTTLTKAIQSKEISDGQASAIWYTLWNGSRSKTYESWAQKNGYRSGTSNEAWMSLMEINEARGDNYIIEGDPVTQEEYDEDYLSRGYYPNRTGEVRTLEEWEPQQNTWDALDNSFMYFEEGNSEAPEVYQEAFVEWYENPDYEGQTFENFLNNYGDMTPAARRIFRGTGQKAVRRESLDYEFWQAVGMANGRK